MTIDEALYEKIVSLGEVTARVQSRVFARWRSQLSALPAMTFFRVDTTISQSSKGRTKTERARFQIDIFATSHRQARAIADALKTGLDGWTHASDPAISYCGLDSEQDLSEDTGDGSEAPTARITQDWILWYSVG
jgi:hypothetical protein